MKSYLWIIKLTALLTLSSLLPSCAMIPGYSEPSDQKVISAIGFDSEGDGITVYMKTVATESAPSELLQGNGDSIEIAISSLLSEEQSVPEASHCALAVLGDGVDQIWLTKILDYFARNDTLTSSVYFVTATSAKALLSIEGVSGYELARAIGECGENPGMDAESRYYRIVAARLEEEGIFALPHFYSDGEKAELYGMSVFRNDRRTLTLTRAESGYYMMIRGLFKGGPISGDSAGLSGSIGVAKCRTEYVFSDGALKIVCHITPDSDLGGDQYADELCAYTKKKLSALYLELSERYGDVFKLYSEAERQGARFDSGSTVTFECTVKGASK